MADPLLTTLCSICHISPPKYTCPCCSLRTCSLACIRKHKSWSDCTGQRDPTVYLTRSQLKTAKGLDHDYNFLHGIERAVERGERVVVGDKGLLKNGDLRPTIKEEVKWKVGRDGRKRRMVVKTEVRPRGRFLDKRLVHKLGERKTEMQMVAKGMMREKENGTRVDKKTGQIIWQVEWVLLDHDRGEDSLPKIPDGRLLTRTGEEEAIWKGFADAVKEEETRSLSKDQRRETRSRQWREAQRSVGATWDLADTVLQDPGWSTWIASTRPSLDRWPSEQAEAYQFFLASPHNRADQPQVITRLDPTECLRKVLAETRVLEYPTICLLKSGMPLPPAYVLGPKDKATVPGTADFKRRNQDRQSLPHKKRKTDVEDGEVSGEEDVPGASYDEDDETSSSGSSSEDEDRAEYS